MHYFNIVCFTAMWPEFYVVPVIARDSHVCGSDSYVGEYAVITQHGLSFNPMLFVHYGFYVAISAEYSLQDK